MNRKPYASVLALSVCLIALALLTSCSSSSTPVTPPPPVVSIAATSGSGQATTVGTAFAAPLVATVTTGGTPTAGVTVTFTAPASGASGTFSGGTATETDTTDSNGVATSSAFTANATTGAYSVTASATGATSSASFALTNNAVSGTTTSLSFYLSGEEAINAGPNYYALAGAVTIDSSGSVLGGEQDYNDAFGITSPEPSGDSIIGGTLTVDGTTGQGTLTLITNNTNVGVAGAETLGVQFVNANHALIMQFDGTATSSGSMDTQSLTSAPSGGFAFTLSGVDSAYSPVGFGGVFSISGTTLSNGLSDVNDAGTISTDNPFSGTLSAADAYGRGTITGITFSGAALSITYYIVGPEVIRIIDVDATDSAVGSAFGQGANATAANNASLGSSVLALANNPWSSTYGALGQFTTSNTSSDPADFSGVGDVDELDNNVFAQASAMSGTYSIASNGYGSLTITGGLGGSDVNALGIYITDPNINLNDPNNPSGGGGAVVLDLDAFVAGGTGVLVPQTDASTASFTGNYGVGWQNFNYYNVNCPDCEFDMIAQGAMTAGALSLTGLVSDPFLTWGTPDMTSSGDTFTGTPLPDPANIGRYSMLSTNVPANSLDASIDGGVGTFDLIVYQASGGQLFWMEWDGTDVSGFSGLVEQQGSLAGLPATRKPAAKKPAIRSTKKLK